MSEISEKRCEADQAPPNAWMRPNDPGVRKLFEMQQEVSLVLLNDALRVLEDVVVFLAFKESREAEANELLKDVTGALYRGGRL